MVQVRLATALAEGNTASTPIVDAPVVKMPVRAETPVQLQETLPVTNAVAPRKRDRALLNQLVAYFCLTQYPVADEDI